MSTMGCAYALTNQTTLPNADSKRLVNSEERSLFSSKNGTLQQLFPWRCDRLTMPEVIALQLLQMTFFLGKKMKQDDRHTLATGELGAHRLSILNTIHKPYTEFLSRKAEGRRLSWQKGILIPALIRVTVANLGLRPPPNF